MTDAVHFVRHTAVASFVAVSLAQCTLLLSDLPEPIETRANDGGSGGADDGAIGTGGRGGGGAARGGNESGGEDAAGGGSMSGGSSTGGNSTGGRASGGTTSGGTTTGGNETGGDATGGNATGGNATGGNATGGNTTGGNTTGGNTTGGSATGGNTTGGNTTGGNTTGGSASGGMTSGGTSGTGGSDAGRGGAPPDCDRDDDGYTAPGATGCSGPDCDDAEPDAHPTQQSFFEEQRASGGFDYDCNGENERQFGSVLNCSLLSLADCSGEGFSGSLPTCGNSGSWIRCAPEIAPVPLLCEAQSLGTRRMPCR